MARIVLVADDSPTIQKKAVALLKGEGFEVETVSNGVAAIKRLASIHPVVILADVSMPGRDGYEVCDFVKKSQDHSHVPVLLVASDMEPYDQARGSEVHADGIVKKPFEASDLISTVAKFADQFEAATTVVAPPVAPPPEKREPTQEFASFGEEMDYAPTIVQPVTPDFSAAPEGIAFTEPAAEEPPAYQAAPVEIETPMVSTGAGEYEITPEPALEPAPAAIYETSPVMEEPPAPMPVEPPPPHAAEHAPTFIDTMSAATSEPVFIEDQPAPAHAPEVEAYSGTMIFRAPVEIAEPVWKDETVPAPPAPESAGAVGLEPQLEIEPPAPTPEVQQEVVPEPAPAPSSMTATSLDSFSLDDAAAGQVHFASEAAEGAAVENAAPELVVEPEAAPPVLEQVETETVPEAAPAPEAAAVETAPVEPAPEVVPEAVYAEPAPAEAIAEAAPPESAAPDAEIETAPAEMAAPEVAPEVAPEMPPEMAVAPLAFDWDLVYSIVHKVVVRMSPPALAAETVEEIARKLADEVATELTSESAPPAS